MATKDPKHLIWHETLPGRYERGIDEAELFYTSLAKTWEATGRVFFAMTGCIEFSVSFSEHDNVAQIERRVEMALRKAWRTLRYEQPTLASAVEYDTSSQACKKIYETFMNDGDGKKESEWMSKSFTIINNGQSGVEFCNSDPPVEKYATLYLLQPLAKAESVKQNIIRRDLIFRCCHDAIDGIGTLMLLDNLFRLAGQAYDLQEKYPETRFGDEFRNLSPPFRIAAQVPQEATSTHREKARCIVAANAESAKDVIPIFIPFHPGPGIPGTSYRTAIYLSKGETDKILQKCKAAGVSVTEAFHAGIAVAVADMQEKSNQPWQGRYIDKCLVNLRSFCDPPYNTSQHAATVYHSGSGRTLTIDITIPAKPSPPPTREARAENFLAVVRQIKAFYATVRSDPDHIAMVPLYYDAITPPYPTTPRTAIPPANPRPWTTISSLGIVERVLGPRHGAFCLEDPWVAADELSPGVGLFLATWKGRLCVSAAFNLAFHQEVEMRAFLARVWDAVRVGLGAG